MKINQLSAQDHRSQSPGANDIAQQKCYIQKVICVHFPAAPGNESAFSLSQRDINNKY